MQEITLGVLNEYIKFNNLTIVLFFKKDSIIGEYLICVCKKIEKLFNCHIFQIEMEEESSKGVFPRLSVYFKSKILETLYGFNNFNKTSSFVKKYL